MTKSQKDKLFTSSAARVRFDGGNGVLNELGVPSPSGGVKSNCSGDGGVSVGVTGVRVAREGVAGVVGLRGRGLVTTGI